MLKISSFFVYIQRVPTLRGFWDLKKTGLREIRVRVLILINDAELFIFDPNHERDLHQIHWNKLLCWMYGLAVIASVARLNICQILMRLRNGILLQIFFGPMVRTMLWNIESSEHSWNKILFWLFNGRPLQIYNLQFAISSKIKKKKYDQIRDLEKLWNKYVVI